MADDSEQFEEQEEGFIFDEPLTDVEDEYEEDVESEADATVVDHVEEVWPDDF